MVDCSHKNHQASGFTLMEVLIATVVLSFSVLALTYAIAAGQMSTYLSMHESRAISLTEAMLDEVFSLPYNDPQGASSPGPEAGESTRADFDNVDDYHGLTEATGTVTDLGGATYPQAFDVFSRTVSTSYTTVNLPGLGGDQNGLLVTVTVTDDNQRTWSLSRFLPEPAS